MRLKECHVTNFGSYKDLIFYYHDNGLSLVHGATGAGKSTFMDAACWVLFGKTSKGGSVDDIRNWNNGNETTEGFLTVDTKIGELIITRIRGKAGLNDLYFVHDTKHDGPILFRGKDIMDTQRLINDILGMDYSKYVDSAYFSEFSAARTFFVDRPSKQKEIFKNLVNLNTPLIIRTAVSKELKINTDSYSECNNKIRTLEGSLHSLKDQYTKIVVKENEWIASLEVRLHTLSDNYNDFESNKERDLKSLNEKYVKFETEIFGFISDSQEDITKLTKIITDCEDSGNLLPCTTCGVVNSPLVNKYELYKEKLERATLYNSSLKNSVNPFLSRIQDVESRENYHEVVFQNTLKEQNPYTDTRKSLNDTLNEVDKDLKDKLFQLSILQHKKQALGTLHDLCLDLEGALLQKTIKNVEDQVNYYMETCFHSMIKVDLSLGASDDLTVTLQKNGYQCTYKQLSKGQRGVLNLCLGVAIMKISANQLGIHFDNLFFDEALDGLDSELKVKAFSLFSLLEIDHESIFLIDHELGLQNLFTKKFKVTMNADTSQIRVDDV